MSNTIAYATQTTTAITVQQIDNALSAVTAYRTACDGHFAQLKATVDGLKTNNTFIGEASDGFAEFFGQVSPLLTTNLVDVTNPESLLSGLVTILEGVKQTIIEQQDPALGNANAGAMSGQGAAAV